MPTSPATAADAAPRLVGRPSTRVFDDQPASTAAAGATVVVRNALAATAPAASAEPALKPYQPNHSNPAPSSVAGRLCGRIGWRGQPRRRPRTSASASADTRS